MNGGGWIKLHRRIIESPVFDNDRLFKVWIWCLCKANHEEDREMMGLREIKLNPGQFILGLPKASKELGIPQTSLKRYLDVLENMQMIVRKVESKFSVITVENWRTYQVNTETDGKQMENKWKTSGKQVETYKNVKNIKNDKNIYLSRDARAREEKKIFDNSLKAFGVMRNVMLTEEQREELFNTYENSGKLIDKVSVWLPEHPRKNHFATCLTFAQNAEWKKKKVPEKGAQEAKEVPGVPMPEELREKFKTTKPYKEVTK